MENQGRRRVDHLGDGDKITHGLDRKFLKKRRIDRHRADIAKQDIVPVIGRPRGVRDADIAGSAAAVVHDDLLPQFFAEQG